MIGLDGQAAQLEKRRDYSNEIHKAARKRQTTPLLLNVANDSEILKDDSHSNEETEVRIKMILSLLFENVDQVKLQ